MKRASIVSGDAQSLPLFQQLARGDPPHGDDVRPVSAVAAAGRGSALRARHRHLPRNGSVLLALHDGVRALLLDVITDVQRVARFEPNSW